MPPDTAQRLLEAATRAFAGLGFEGASVRAICKAAGVNAQAIHYHFGSKHKLYRAAIERFLQEQDAIVARLLTTKAANIEDLRTRLFFFLDTILEFWARGPGLELVYQESRRHGPNESRIHESMIALDGSLVALLESSRDAGLLRTDVDLALVAATLTERVGSNAIDAEMMEAFYGESVRNAETRREWLGKLIDLVLFGAAEVRSPGKGD